MKLLPTLIALTLCLAVSMVACAGGEEKVIFSLEYIEPLIKHLAENDALSKEQPADLYRKELIKAVGNYIMETNQPKDLESNFQQAWKDFQLLYPELPFLTNGKLDKEEEKNLKYTIEQLETDEKIYEEVQEYINNERRQSHRRHS